MRKGLLLLIVVLLASFAFAAVPVITNQGNSIQDNDILKAGSPLLNIATDIAADVMYRLNGSANVSVYSNTTSGSVSVSGSVEGDNQIVVYAYNPANYGEVSTLTITYRVDATNPVVSLNRNGSGSLQAGADSIQVTWNATDNYLDFYEANITDPNGLVLERSTDYSPLTVSAGNLTIAGNYIAIVYANDTAGNEQTQTLQFTVVNPASSVNLNSPTNNAILNDDDVVFFCNATDDNPLSTIELWNNFQGSWSQDGSVSYGENQSANFTRNNLVNGEFEWNCRAVDSFGVGSFAGSNFTVTIDDNSPDVTLFEPGPGLRSNDQFVYFNFSTDDDVAAKMVCNLTVNDKVKQNNVKVDNGTSKGFNISSFSSGNYTWFVTCDDTAGNGKKSAERNFVVDIPAGQQQVVVSAPEPVPKKAKEANKTTINSKRPFLIQL